MTISLYLRVDRYDIDKTMSKRVLRSSPCSCPSSSSIDTDGYFLFRVPLEDDAGRAGTLKPPASIFTLVMGYEVS